MKRTLKKAMSILFVVVMVFGATVIFGGVDFGGFIIKAEAAEKFTSGYYQYTLDEYGNASIIDVDNSISGEVEVPSNLDGFPVTTIGDSAFYDCKSITSVIIPNSITKMGAAVFRNCIALTSVELSDNLEIISSYLFDRCSALTEINIPDSVSSIGSYAFVECTALKSISIGKGVTHIWTGAFRRCYSIETVTIPDNVQRIYGGAFFQCTNLKEVTLGEGVIDIGDGAFSDCTNLEVVNFNAKNCDKMGRNSTNYVFEDCSSLETVNIGSSVVSIPELAFAGCDSLKKVVINDGPTTIGKNAFLSCDSLESIEFIGNSVRVIGEYAFFACKKLQSFILPKGITSIKGYAFSGCTNLEFLHIPQSTTQISDFIVNKEKTVLCSDTNNCYAKEYADKNGYMFRLCDGHGLTDNNGLILTPSTTTLDYGETLILHINQEYITDNKTIVWSADGNAVVINPSEDGKTCEVTSTGTGTVNVSVTLIDDNGNVTATSVEITSNASLWNRIVSFFFNLFKFNRIIEQ